MLLIVTAKSFRTPTVKNSLFFKAFTVNSLAIDEEDVQQDYPCTIVATDMHDIQPPLPFLSGVCAPD